MSQPSTGPFPEYRASRAAVGAAALHCLLDALWTLSSLPALLERLLADSIFDQGEIWVSPAGEIKHDVSTDTLLRASLLYVDFYHARDKGQTNRNGG